MDVAILVVDGVADFGLAAVRETLNMANALREELDPPPRPWNVRLVARSESVLSGHGNTVPATPFADLSGDFDLLIVPAVNLSTLSGGGADAVIHLVSSPANRPALDLISSARAAGVGLGAACTGTFFLGEAGALDGERATTSWWLGPAFRRRYPKVELDEGRTLCRGHGVMTAGAALSHVDLALSLVHLESPALAELTGRYLVTGNRKNQLDVMIPEVIARGDQLVAAFERWVRDHLATRFLISRASHELGVTERSLQRATAAELGMSPRDFVNEIRLERATHLLRTTALTVEAVAVRVGYLNASTLRGLIRRRRDMSIRELKTSRPLW